MTQPPDNLFPDRMDELAGTPAFGRFVEERCPSLADGFLGAPDRRQFLKLMGASMALAGLSGCRWPKEEIVPFAHRPPGRTPGVPQRFATCMERCGVGHPLLVTSTDGRPIKVEGNPDHPQSRGAADAFAQASVLGLYDPDRSRYPVRGAAGRGIPQTWNDFAAFAGAHFAELLKKEGAGLHLLTETTSSPSFLAARDRVARAFPQAKWYEYDPLSRDNSLEGARLAFGRPLRPQLRIPAAGVIVSFDEDFLLHHPAAVAHARDFAGRRRADDGTMARLYVVESAHSLTGSMADHRHALPPSKIPEAAVRLAALLFFSRGIPLPLKAKVLLPVLAGLRADDPAFAFLEGVSRDLAANRGGSLVMAGLRQPPEVHALVHLMNSALGNDGRTIEYADELERVTHVESIGRLAAAMAQKQVETLLVLGGNPVLTAPADLEFARHWASVPVSIHLGLYRDETGDACTWHLPQSHYLEAWGDACAWDGSLLLQQPLIEPLYGGRSPIEILAVVLGEPPTGGYDLVRGTFGVSRKPADFEAAWRKALHNGFVEGSRSVVVQPALRETDWAARLEPFVRGKAAPGKGALEAVFLPGASVHDGRFANNAWLQETPDPMTKLTWDNAALIAPATAGRLGLAHGDVVRLRCGSVEAEVPVFVMPGQAEETLGLTLGYGRTHSGRVGNGVGVDFYPFRSTGAWSSAEVEIVKTGRRHLLAVAQDAIIADAAGRDGQAERLGRLFREATLDRYRKEPHFAGEEGGGHAESAALWEAHKSGGVRWGMAIDLTACTGCSACMVACQAENNIPVVGKDEVSRGRGMYWLRVDRYFSGDGESPSVAHQPVTCHHCEDAPCEQVCPVAATSHSSEGLNDMVYNRCVGTRYCSNNCPYKVRRFNWFLNHQNLSETERMVLNPEVTVRSRGVMEKCTFCVQRIQHAKIAAKNDRRPVRDGEIVPACAQTCPAEAIVFGDLGDPESRVSRLHRHPRAYAMLAELNVKPRTRYLARLRNPAS